MISAFAPVVTAAVAAVSDEKGPATGARWPAFHLISHGGEQLTNRDFSGKLVALFFGFTHCPGMCPLAMTAMTSALDNMDKEKASRVAPVFVSVDPERDTPERLKTFLAAYHPALVGLTGTPAEIKAFSDAYGVFVSKVEGGTAKEYNVDHSGFIYLTDGTGAFVEAVPYDAGPAKIAERLTFAVNGLLKK